ncbi:MAG: chemotaxis protein CheX [Spirochaetes bacterium]|nr:chemotaxis protein CheX [Spirochaetota bacterium]MBN2769546.1 chemotaxis protein CheX [Spirochaetota bacterium]HRX15307.1 chemotaxis protein CheX [Spirochaetota bacterium]
MKTPDEVKDLACQYFEKASDSIAFIFKSLLGLSVEPKRLYAKRLNSLPNDIIINIDYRSGETEGFISFFFSLKIAMHICEKLVPSVDTTSFSEDHLDILGEMGNMISGNAISKFQLINQDMRIQTPYHSGYFNILAAEKTHWIFSSNYECDLGKVGILLAQKKDI